MINKGADQTVWMRRLVCACVVRLPSKTGFLTSRPNDFGLDVRKRVLGFLITQDLNQSPQLQRIARKLKIQLINSLISLRLFAGWSAPLLLANLEDRFSHIEAQSVVNRDEFIQIII